MIGPDYVRAMARYNAWQNASLYGAADSLDDAARQAERGAFFGSIEATLNHILWGDRMWMNRLAGTQRPAGTISESRRLTPDWAALRIERDRTDAEIAAWAAAIDAPSLEGDITWFSGAAGREVTKPRWLLTVHMFNHQTHHRGQVHAMLTAAGTKPGDTDLFLMPEV